MVDGFANVAKVRKRKFDGWTWNGLQKYLHPNSHKVLICVVTLVNFCINLAGDSKPPYRVVDRHMT